MLIAFDGVEQVRGKSVEVIGHLNPALKSAWPAAGRDIFRWGTYLSDHLGALTCGAGLMRVIR